MAEATTPKPSAISSIKFECYHPEITDYQIKERLDNEIAVEMERLRQPSAGRRHSLGSAPTLHACVKGSFSDRLSGRSWMHVILSCSLASIDDDDLKICQP